MSLFWPNKADLENANWVLRDRLGKPNQRTTEWPTNLPRTQEEFNQLIADAKKFAEENKWKYLPTEISEFEQLLSEYYAKTPGAQLSNLRNETGPVVPVAAPVSRVESPVVSKNLQELHTKLRQGNEEPITVESLTKLLSLLDGEKSPEARAMIINTLWSRLAAKGFTMMVVDWSIVIENPKDASQAQVLQLTLNNQLGSAFQLPEIQSSIITGTGKFGLYTETQRANINKATLWEYVNFLVVPLGITLTGKIETDARAIKNNTQATLSEKAFLMSYINWGYSGYNIVPDVQRRLELKKQNIELHTSSVFLATEKIVGTASAGKLATEKAAMKQGWKSEELTLDTFMDNPTIAIAKYPWTSLTLLIAWIWKFGFMKTIGGLLVGSIGLKALNEIGTETGLGKQIKDGLKKWAKVAGEAAEEAFDSGKAAAASATAAAGEAMKPAEKKDEFSESPTQKKISDKIRNSEEFKKIFEKEKNKNKATLDEYLLFINKDLSGFKVSRFLSKSYSVFTENVWLDPSIKLPNNFNSAIFRDIMRMYFTGDYISEFKIQEENNITTRRSALAKIPSMDVSLADAINKIHS
jgi:hypothetical protein